MIREFQFDDGKYGFTFIDDDSYNNFFKLLKVFEDSFKPIEKLCVSGWHDVIYEYVLDEFKNNKIRIECSDEIVTIMFTQYSDDNSKESLKNIAETMNDKIKAV